MIIYAIIVLKSVIYDLKFLFVESTKGEFIIDIIKRRVSTSIEITNFVAINKIKYFKKNSDSLYHIRNVLQYESL